MTHIIVADKGSITVNEEAAEGATKAAVARLSWAEYAKAVSRGAPDEERRRLFDVAMEAEEAAQPFTGQELDKHGRWTCDKCESKIDAHYLKCPKCLSVDTSSDSGEGWRCRCLQLNAHKRFTCLRCDTARRIGEISDL